MPKIRKFITLTVPIAYDIAEAGETEESALLYEKGKDDEDLCAEVYEHLGMGAEGVTITQKVEVIP